MTNVNTAKSITLKNIGIELPVGGGAFLNKAVALVVGKARSYIIKHTNYGESYALQGDFMVANTITGEVFEGNTIYLPNDYALGIAGALDKHEGGEVLIGSDETPLEIIVAESKKAARGYSFVVRNASTPKVVQARLAMANALTNTLAQLPKPQGETEAKAKKSAQG